MTRRRIQGHRAWLMFVCLSCLGYMSCTSLPAEQSPPPTALHSLQASPSALYQAGLTQLASGEYLQARLSLEQAVALAPSQASYHNALGLANLQLGRFSQA